MTCQLRSTVLLCCTVLFYSCSSGSFSDPAADGIYKLYDISAASGNADFDKIADLKSKMAEGEVLALFRDKSFTRIIGQTQYTHGRWRLDDKLVIFLPSHNRQEKTILNFHEPKQAKSKNAYLEMEDNGMIFKFIKTSPSLDKPVNDPLHPYNNVWRSKPANAEDSLEIKRRLSNYIKHLALTLKASHDRKENVVSIEHSRGPVQIYRSGIGIIPYEEVAESWKTAFFNEDQAAMAYRLYMSALASGKYSGAASESWAMDDYNILLSIYSRIQK